MWYRVMIVALCLMNVCWCGGLPKGTTLFGAPRRRVPVFSVKEPMLQPIGNQRVIPQEPSVGPLNPFTSHASKHALNHELKHVPTTHFRKLILKPGPNRKH